MTQKLDFSALAHTQPPNFLQWMSGGSDAASVAAYRQTAVVNGFNYVPKDPRFLPGSGTVFNQGSSPSCLNIFSGTFAELPFHLFHCYTAKTDQYITVFRFALPRLLPHVVIDSNVEGAAASSTLPRVFTREQQVPLEGDFAKYFATYAPKSYEQSMVNILAPDIMHALLANAAHCDTEIVDNYVYFYWPYTLTSPQDVQKIFTTAGAVMSELHDKLSRSDIYGTAEQRQLHGNDQPQGVHLKKKSELVDKLSRGAIIAIIAVMYLMPDFAQNYTNLLIVLLVILGAQLAFSYYKKKRLNKELSRRNKIL